MSLNQLFGIFMDKEKFIKDLMSSNKIVLLDMFATWCGPCKVMKSVVEEFKEKHKEVRVEFIDIDIHTKLVEMFNIHSIPAFIFIKDGVAVCRCIGVQTIENLEKCLKIAIETNTK